MVTLSALLDIVVHGVDSSRKGSIIRKCDATLVLKLPGQAVVEQSVQLLEMLGAWLEAHVTSWWCYLEVLLYNDVIMSAMASQITILTIVYSTVYSGTDQRKHRSSKSLAFVRGIHRWPVNSPHKGPVTRKMFPFDDVVMLFCFCPCTSKIIGNQKYHGTRNPLDYILAGSKSLTISHWIEFC